jgi:hypothetical protein
MRIVLLAAYCEVVGYHPVVASHERATDIIVGRAAMCHQRLSMDSLIGFAY